MGEELQSEDQNTNDSSAEQVDTSASSSNEIKLDGLFAFKVGMSSVYTEDGSSIPVTVLKLDPWTVTQIKSKDKDGYNAVQVTLAGRKAHKSGKAQLSRNKKAGLDTGTRVCKEVRYDKLPEGAAVGQAVSLESLKKGDVVKITAKSKGRGFAGVMKRWNFGGGPASHGSSTHRRPGSMGMCTFPGMVLPGKKSPGHMGDRNISVKNVKVVDVNPKDGVILLKGPVPGARNGLVRLLKQ